MPFVRIDLRQGKSTQYRKTIGEIVYSAMRDVIDVPDGDKFQVITEHPAEGLNIAPSYLGNDYSAIVDDPRVSPIWGVRPGSMPPSFIICGTADPLVAQSQALAEALKSADTRHELHVIDSMPHAFMQMEPLPGCAEGHRLMFDFLKRAV